MIICGEYMRKNNNIKPHSKNCIIIKDRGYELFITKSCRSESRAAGFTLHLPRLLVVRIGRGYN